MSWEILRANSRILSCFKLRNFLSVIHEKILSFYDQYLWGTEHDACMLHDHREIVLWSRSKLIGIIVSGEVFQVRRIQAKCLSLGSKACRPDYVTAVSTKIKVSERLMVNPFLTIFDICPKNILSNRVRHAWVRGGFGVKVFCTLWCNFYKFHQRWSNWFELWPFVM